MTLQVNFSKLLNAKLKKIIIKIISKSPDKYFEQALNNIAKVQENDFTSCIIDDKLEVAILSRIKELIELTTRLRRHAREPMKHSRILPTKLC